MSSNADFMINIDDIIQENLYAAETVSQHIEQMNKILRPFNQLHKIVESFAKPIVPVNTLSSIVTKNIFDMPSIAPTVGLSAKMNYSHNSISKIIESMRISNNVPLFSGMGLPSNQAPEPKPNIPVSPIYIASIAPLIALDAPHNKYWQRLVGKNEILLEFLFLILANKSMPIFKIAIQLLTRMALEYGVAYVLLFYLGLQNIFVTFLISYFFELHFYYKK